MSLIHFGIVGFQKSWDLVPIEITNLFHHDLYDMKSSFGVVILPCHSFTLSRYYVRECERGGTSGVSDEEEIDVGKLTLSGPDCTGCGATGAIMDTYRKLPNTRERERERERESYTDSTHAFYVQKQRKETHPTSTEKRICTTMFIYIIQEQDTTSSLSRTKQVRLQQQPL